VGGQWMRTTFFRHVLLPSKWASASRVLFTVKRNKAARRPSANAGGVDRLPLMDERWKDAENFSGKRVTRSFVRARRGRKCGKETSSYDRLKDWAQNCLTDSFSFLRDSFSSDFVFYSRTHAFFQLNRMNLAVCKYL